MAETPQWLPQPILYATYGGNWDRFIAEVYAKFKTDFLDDLNRKTLMFEGSPLSLRRHPLVRGKEASFWHLISTGNIEEERLPDMRRCEYIGWARAVIDNSADSAIKKWTSIRGTNVNICLWLESENYLVILGKRTGYLLLLTAYFAQNHKRKKLLQEHAQYISSLKS